MKGTLTCTLTGQDASLTIIVHFLKGGGRGGGGKCDWTWKKGAGIPLVCIFIIIIILIGFIFRSKDWTPGFLLVCFN